MTSRDGSVDIVYKEDGSIRYLSDITTEVSDASISDVLTHIIGKRILKEVNDRWLASLASQMKDPTT